MALNQYVFGELVRLKTENGRACSAGYPDALVPQAEIKDKLGVDGLELRTDREEMAKWHGAKVPTEIVETRTLFKALGYELTVFDVEKWRGGEVIIDLNLPLSQAQAEWYGRFDLVLDLGTLEHCFNIAQAARNLLSLVKVGGRIVHHLPLSYFNHGFYNLNPLWFRHIMEAAGFEIERLRGEVRGMEFTVPDNARFLGVPDNAMLFCVAKRVSDAEWKWPIQNRYRGKPGA